MTVQGLETVAVVGTGVIGRSWAQLFARAGLTTRLYDRDPKQVAKAVAWIETDLASCAEAGRFSSDEVRTVLISALVASFGPRLACEHREPLDVVAGGVRTGSP